MNKNKIVRYFNYDKLPHLGVFHSYGSDFIGGCIRIGERGLFAAMDKTTPNHSGLLFHIYGQVFAAEVGLRGIELNSIDKYRSKNNWIVSVYFWRGFENEPIAALATKYLSEWIRRKQESGYDLFGAIRASAWARNLFPWLKNDPEKEFCSEDVYSFLKRFGAIFSPACSNNPPNPYSLSCWMKNNPGEYLEKKDFYVTGKK